MSVLKKVNDNGIKCSVLTKGLLPIELAEFNKETSESIRNVVTSHYMEFKKYIKSNETQHKLYDAKLLQFNKEN